jgi:hypothetical protein
VPKHLFCAPLTVAFLTSLLSVGCSKSEEPSGNDKPLPVADDAGIQDLGPCDSTWKAVQRSIFVGRGCSEATCHTGTDKAGGLDLSPDVAYDNLIFKDAEASLAKPLYRVHPGEQALSLLYLKLSASTEGTALPAGAGAPMPTGKTPLSEDELTGIKLWIRAGAPQTGVVEGTQDLLGCDLPTDADPNRTARPPVPAADEGFQHAAGTWTVNAHSEDEVCFATYYDLSDSAPDWARFPCLQQPDSTCVGFKSRQLSQDAQSHHSIITVYTGSAAPSDPSWGAWRCVGGPSEGATCNPTALGVSADNGGADCGDQGVCQSTPHSYVACRGFGPSDRDTKTVNAGGAQSPVSSQEFPEGVYGQVPIKGVIIWNSHGFNLTSKPAVIGQYNTFWYAQPEERVYPVRRIFDQRYIFAMDVPPYQKHEYCASFTLPRYAHLAELSSHAHKRGVLWRTWLPTNQPNCVPNQGCMPNGVEPDYISKVYNDPVTLPFDPPLTFDSADDGERTLKYCNVYDNGADYPELVKRKSALPMGSAGCGPGKTYCYGGEKKGEACMTDADCGADGACDACMVSGGVTTEDEMFILLGDYYVVPPT